MRDVHSSLDHHLRNSGGWSCINICVMHATVGTSIFGVLAKLSGVWKPWGTNLRFAIVEQAVVAYGSTCSTRLQTKGRYIYTGTFFTKLIYHDNRHWCLQHFFSRNSSCSPSFSLDSHKRKYFVVEAHKSEPSIIQTQSKTSTEGTTGLTQNILLVSIGKRAKMTPVDAQVFIVPAKKKKLSKIEWQLRPPSIDL